MTDDRNAEALRVVVGVDLRPTCQGALNWVRWLGDADRGATEVVAVHATQWHEVWEDVGVTTELAEIHTRDFLRERGLGWAPRVFGGRAPVDALAHAVGLHRADLLVLGRRARRDEDRLVQLGTVARRLLRTLPCPVVVCPPDLESAEVERGPIVLATVPDATCEGALRLARRLAARLDRPLVAVSVLPPGLPTGISYLPAPSSAAERNAKAEAAVLQWLAARDFTDTPRWAEGPPVTGLLDAAAELGASAIVCGSRLLSLTDRILHTSVGSALAAVAPIPVLVAPPEAPG